ncbi:MAG: hypothetical protein GEU99_14890 [Luteitalea sp.]|nr:hypothetical protein [Luteitalea sp.]
MSWMTERWRRIRSIGRRHEMESGLDEEIRFHIDQQIEKNLRAGMSLDEARRQASVKFGGMERVKESTRDEFRSALVEDSVRDFRYGIRALRRAPGFTIISSLMLALGIGATTAVFSVVNGVLVKPLPYPRPEELVSLGHTAQDVRNAGGDMSMSAAQLFTYRDENRSFQQMGVWSAGTESATGGTEPEEIQSLYVSYGTLRALGEQPLMGRSKQPWTSSPDLKVGIGIARTHHEVDERALALDPFAGPA